MKILFVGNLESDEIVSAPAKVGYEIFCRTLNKYKNVQFFTYFQDGTKHSRFQKLFGKHKVEKGILQLGLFPFLLNVLIFRPDIMQITSISVYYLIAFPFLKLLGTKIFYTVHSVNKYTLDRFTLVEGKIKKRLLLSEKISLLFSSKVFMLSKKEKECLLTKYNLKSKKIEIMNNGITLLEIKKNYIVDSTKVRIITVGSLERKEKGLNNLIKVLEKLDFEIELTICYFRKHLKKISSSKSNLKLIWLDPLNEIELRKEYIKNDFFITLAEYEPFGIAFLEAMNSGLLFLATDRVGLTERFDAYLKEYVIPFGEWDIAKDKLKCLVNLSASQKQKLSHQIIEFSNQFTWDRVIQKYLIIYDEQI